MSGTREALLAAGAEAAGEARWAAARDAYAAALAVETTGEALLGLAEASWWLGELAESVAYRERAYTVFRDAGDLVGAANAAVLLCLDYRKQYGDAASSGGWLARATRLVEDHGLDELRGWLLFAASLDCDDAVRAEALARDAYAFGTATGDRDLELCALSQTGVSLVAQGRVVEGVRCLDESMAVALGAEGSPDTVVFTSCMMMTSCTRCAEYARAAQWVRKTVAFTERYGCPFLYAECRILYGGVLLATGEWDRAEEELRVGLEMTRGAVPALHRLAVATLAELWLARGRAEEAASLVEGYADHAETAAVLARLHLHHGRPAAAAAVAHRPLAAAAAPGLDGGVLLELLGEARLAAGDAAAAARHGRELADLGAAGGSGLLRARGDRLVGRAAAATGDLALARARLDAALVGFARLEMPWEVVRTRLWLAETLRDVDAEVAVAEARAALAAAEALGAGGAADAAAALLRALGVRAARTGPRQGGDLTRREEEVLALLGEGLSNPEIAARLHLSRKTVEHHVAHVLAKLGLRGRAEAAAASVRRRGSSAGK